MADTPPQGKGVDAQPSSEFGERVARTPVYDDAVYPSVILLRLRRRPATILWTVVAIIVDAVKRHARGPISHVGKKVQKVIPAITNFYPAPAIAGIAGVLRIGAALKHRGPRIMNGTLGETVALRVYFAGARI
jgi:hypothetical protein